MEQTEPERFGSKFAQAMLLLAGGAITVVAFQIPKSETEWKWTLVAIGLILAGLGFVALFWPMKPPASDSKTNP